MLKNCMFSGLLRETQRKVRQPTKMLSESVSIKYLDIEILMLESSLIFHEEMT